MTSLKTTKLAADQKDAFLNGLGDNWLKRNRNDLGKKDDPVPLIMEHVGLTPRNIMEVGCANGWRLKKLHEKYGCPVYGIDPSEKGIKEARKALGHDEWFAIGTADRIPVPDGSVQVLILGFCMFFIEQKDWLAVAAETTRVLEDGGVLIIHDNIAPRPLRLEYIDVGEKGMSYFYFYDWAKLWLSHPGYVKIAESTKMDKSITEAATLLQKQFSAMFQNVWQSKPNDAVTETTP